jgi:hypothetical protein
VNTLTQLLKIVAFLALAVVSVRAQDEEKPEERAVLVRQPPERVERATAADDKGALQWAEHKGAQCLNCKGAGKSACLTCDRFEEGQSEKCPECANEKQATCRVCFGAGTLPDPLLGSPCPTCGGAAMTVCSICQGRGQMRVSGGGERPQRCDCCKGLGALPCGTCKGRRFVEHPKFKPSFADAKAADYAKAIDVLDKLIESLPTFESTGDSRKDAKAYGKLVAPGQKQFPVLKLAQAHFEDAKKAEAGGSVWKHYVDVVPWHTGMAKDNLEYWLKYEKRITTLAMQRAQKNEEAAAAAGKK